MKIRPLREKVELNKEQKEVMKRMMEEFVHRTGTHAVTFDVFKENLETYPSFGGYTHFEFQIGQRKLVRMVSDLELDNPVTFYYVLRRMCDEVIMELIKLGASYA